MLGAVRGVFTEDHKAEAGSDHALGDGERWKRRAEWTGAKGCLAENESCEGSDEERVEEPRRDESVESGGRPVVKPVNARFCERRCQAMRDARTEREQHRAHRAT